MLFGFILHVLPISELMYHESFLGWSEEISLHLPHCIVSATPRKSKLAGCKCTQGEASCPLQGDYQVPALVSTFKTHLFSKKFTFNFVCSFQF